ncbi:MAG: ABC transporter ATP-binding protein [Desulfobacula sp.]|jgi:peptide/nickel transport system ATP-binding protein|nr:ABC transporter ATP-binding protein [Desulfobacula sp.]
MSHLLDIHDLEVKFALRTGDITAIDGIDLTLDKGETLGLVGESGAGKSVTGFSIINLISKPGYISKGKIIFNGDEISSYSDEKMREIRGNKISMIFQDPMMTLNPVFTIGFQMIETLQAHQKISKSDARDTALEKLKKVHIPSPEQRLSQYPHELSGGMRQRIIIAISLLTDPAIIIADEPTTALDVTIQAEIMDLLQELCESDNMALILITHDLGVVSQVTEKIAVMYAGKIIECGPTDQVVKYPVHPYTEGLIKSIPGTVIKPGCDLVQIPGMMPTLTNIPPGCAFNPRCYLKEAICTTKTPKLKDSGNGVLAACHMK